MGIDKDQITIDPDLDESVGIVKGTLSNVFEELSLEPAKTWSTTYYTRWRDNRHSQ